MTFIRYFSAFSLADFGDKVLFSFVESPSEYLRKAAETNPIAENYRNLQ